MTFGGQYLFPLIIIACVAFFAYLVIDFSVFCYDLWVFGQYFYYVVDIGGHIGDVAFMAVEVVHCADFPCVMCVVHQVTS